MRNQLVFAGVSTLAFMLLLTLTFCTTEQVSALSRRKLYDTCEDAGCEAKNLSCCYDDGNDDDFDSDYDQGGRRIDDTGYLCCDHRLGVTLGLSLGVGISAVGFICFLLSFMYCKCKKRKAVTTVTVTTTPGPVYMSTSSYPPTSRNKFPLEPSLIISNSSHAKPVVTNSYDLYPPTSTSMLRSLFTEQQAGSDGDTKLITDAPPSYSSLYS